MSKSKALASRLEEVLLNGSWIATTNIQEQLDSITWHQAIYKIGNHNTIAELTFHINYYVGGILNVYCGGELEIRDKYSFDMQPITSAEDWTALIKSFKSNAIAIVQKVSLTTEEQWEAPFVKAAYGTYHRNIEGLIEHSYYHFGQISLLKKLIIPDTDEM